MATVLCVDDDRNLCRILEKALRGAGHRVIAAHDGDQAVALARDESPELALLDIGLPRKNGFEVAEAVRALPPPMGQIPLLIMSGSRITPRAEKRAESLGVVALLSKPVPLDHLLEVVSAQLKGETPAARPSERKPARETGAGPRLSGTLEEVAFPALLHQLHGLRASGVLLLVAGRKRKAIQFREGYPVAVKSNLVGECLGNLLVREGRLSKAQLQESLQRMKRGEGMQGQILVAMELLSEEEISRTIQRQAAEKLFEIFRWSSGRFKFETGARLKSGNALAVDSSPANWILAGVRRELPITVVNAWLEENARRKVIASQSPFYRLQEIELEPVEFRLFDGASGRKLAELARGGERIRRSLYALVITGLLEFERVGGSARTAARPLPKARTAPASSARPADRTVRPAAKRSAPARRAEPGSPAAAETRAADAPPSAPPRTAMDPEAERTLRAELAAMAERLRGQTYFEMLGLDREADEEAVYSAYDELAARMHPDRFHNSSDSVRQLAREAFDLLTRAHDTLVDPRRRGEYLIQLRKGERNEAERRAAEVALDAEVCFQRGEAKLRARDYEGALECFGESLQRQPEEGEYHAHYGWALYLCHPDEEAMVHEAIEHVRRGVKLARDREKPYLYLGRLYKAIGRTAAAEKMFTRAVQIRPDSVESLRELRVINMRRGKGKGILGRLLRR